MNRFTMKEEEGGLMRPVKGRTEDRSSPFFILLLILPCNSPANCTGVDEREGSPMETQTDSIRVCLTGEDVMTQGQAWKLSWILFVCLSITSGVY